MQGQFSTAGGAHGNPSGRSKRPDSAYRHKQNSSSAANAGSGTAQGTGQALALTDRIVTKRVNKLRIALELEIAENLYSRFIKKGKNFKEKNQGGSQSNQSKTRSFWMTPSMTLAAAYGSNTGKAFTDATSLAPILSTISQSGAGNQNALAGNALSLGPLFARLCPYH